MLEDSSRKETIILIPANSNFELAQLSATRFYLPRFWRPPHPFRAPQTCPSPLYSSVRQLLHQRQKKRFQFTRKSFSVVLETSIETDVASIRGREQLRYNTECRCPAFCLKDAHQRGKIVAATLLLFARTALLSQERASYGRFSFQFKNVRSKFFSRK